MSFSAIVIADSIAHNGKRITTLQLKYPRFIHAEFMTHRVFSRNASSSRAIPVEKMIESIVNDTAMPVHWGKNQPGMQADEECDNLVQANIYQYALKRSVDVDLPKVEAWLEARDRAIDMATAFHKAGYHKQIVNRLLEPFMHINVLVTATEWDNYFELRLHRDAQPEIRVLSEHMKVAMDYSTPKETPYREWHLPYITDEDREQLDVADLLKVSTARCARVSYLTHDARRPDPAEDLRLYERLIGSVPLHASPCEHQASPAVMEDDRFANFKGWIQYRGIVETTVLRN